MNVLTIWALCSLVTFLFMKRAVETIEEQQMYEQDNASILAVLCCAVVFPIGFVLSVALLANITYNKHLERIPNCIKEWRLRKVVDFFLKERRFSLKISKGREQ